VRLIFVARVLILEKIGLISSSYIAHVKRLPDGSWVEHALQDHLFKVGELAASFAIPFAAADWARTAGYWHDLGKYRLAFQRYIKTVSGYDVNAHIEGAQGRVDHSTAGAIFAKQKMGIRGHVLAYLIAGHHAGLPDWNTKDGGGAALSSRLEQAPLVDDAMSSNPPTELLGCELPTSGIPGDVDGFALWVRMLFSCLVDADFLDTERFMDEGKTDARAAFDSLATLKVAFDRHMRNKATYATNTPINRVRADVLLQCIASAKKPPGMFTLTVPTGGGKTLSSMAFALEHAAQHNKRRIIYVIPFTSIIEQTANIFRDIFGENVIEHHSNADESANENHKTRLACENWDAPIIVTTSVQFFESLFAARTSRCRKLHSIVGSVVVLDEAQLIPPELRIPILDTINLLSTYYSVTFVLSTATQPVLTGVKSRNASTGLSSVTEIIDEPAALFEQLERVTYDFPADSNMPTPWQSIADELLTHPTVLCVVNSRRDCLDLHALMPKDTICLSALMCGQHRSEVIARIKETLSAGEPTRVISTQLVEAGVDIDFPVVYRALAGLDSIAQAAGRCNREGKLDAGRVKVFIPPKPAPVGLLRKAAQATKSLLATGVSKALPPEVFTHYFQIFYADVDPQKQQEIQRLLAVDKRTLGCAFRTAAAAFKLIDDETQRSVYVRYGESEALLSMLSSKGPERWLLRKLQRYTVSIPTHTFDMMLATGDVAPTYMGSYFSVVTSAIYGQNGLVVPQDKLMPADNLVI
jgi:CRISPR-associated endonuclease/helicase Cas3